MSKPIRVQGIDVNVQLVFLPEHVELLRPQLEKAGLATNTMDEMIDAYVASGEKVPYERFVLEYGQAVLNPLMNKKLNRPADHPTFNKMLLFVLKDIIESNPIVLEFRKFKLKH